MKQLTKKEKIEVIKKVINMINNKDHNYLCNMTKYVIIESYNRVIEYYWRLKTKLGATEARDKLLENVFPEFVKFIIKEGKKLDPKFKYGDAWCLSNRDNPISFRRKKIKEFLKSISSE